MRARWPRAARITRAQVQSHRPECALIGDMVRAMVKLGARVAGVGLCYGRVTVPSYAEVQCTTTASSKRAGRAAHGRAIGQGPGLWLKLWQISCAAVGAATLNITTTGGRGGYTRAVELG